MGAWIETKLLLIIHHKKLCAPRMGAWIETENPHPTCVATFQSRPAWARGLKLNPRHNSELNKGRAPHGRVD